MGIRWVALAATLAGALTGCASGRRESDNNVGGSAEPSLADAIARWADFPIDASPRPLVLTGPAIDDPASGFRSGDDKIAYVMGSFELATALPTQPSQVDGRPVDTAADAFAELQAQGDGSKVPSRLKVTDAKLGTASFSTDRGQQLLPAWIFSLAGVADPVSVLAVPPANRWPKSEPASGADQLESYTINQDDRRITVTFIGASSGSGPCDAEYSADTVESSTAVAVSIRELAGPRRAGEVACGAVGYSRRVTLVLSAELGNRVLIDATGVPIPEGTPQR